MVRCVCNHAAYFHIHFPYGLLAVPLARLNLESAPLFFCRRCSSRKQERRCGKMKVGEMPSILWAYVNGSTVVIEENNWDNVHKYEVIVFKEETTGRQINSANLLPVTRDMSQQEIQRRISNLLQGIVLKKVIDQNQQRNKEAATTSAAESSAAEIPFQDGKYTVKLRAVRT